MKELVIYILSGIPLTIPSIFYYHDHKHYELSLMVCLVIFLVIHVMLAVIAVLDSGCEKNAINNDNSEVEEQIEKRGENVMPVPGLGVQEPVETGRETAMPVADLGVEAQEEGYEETVVQVEKTAKPGPVSDEKREQNEGCPESVISIPDLEVQEPGFCEKIVR